MDTDQNDCPKKSRLKEILDETKGEGFEKYSSERLKKLLAVANELRNKKDNESNNIYKRIKRNVSTRLKFNEDPKSFNICRNLTIFAIFLTCLLTFLFPARPIFPFFLNRVGVEKKCVKNCSFAYFQGNLACN